jgi:hypothetical protein
VALTALMALLLVSAATACAGTSHAGALRVHGDSGTVPDGTDPVPRSIDGTDAASGTSSVPASNASTGPTSVSPTTANPHLGGSPATGAGDPSAPPSTRASAPPTTAVKGPETCLVTSTTPTTLWEPGPITRDPGFDPSTAGVVAPAAFSRSAWEVVTIWNHSDCILPWHLSGVGACVSLSNQAGTQVPGLFPPNGNSGYVAPHSDGNQVLYVEFSSRPSCTTQSSDSFWVAIDGHSYLVTGSAAT